MEILRLSLNEDSLSSAAVDMAKSGRPRRAAEILENAVRNGVDTVAIRQALGEIYLDLNMNDEATAQFMAGLETDPESIDLRSNLARAIAASGNSEKAEEMYRGILEKKPGHAITHNRLGIFLMQRGRIDEAETSLTEAVRLAPEIRPLSYRFGPLAG